MTTTELENNLGVLEELLNEERYAITHLRMKKLEDVQQRKTELLKNISEFASNISEKSRRRAERIMQSNQRNRKLLITGHKLIMRMQAHGRKNMAPTYGSTVGTFQNDCDAKVLSRRH